MAISGELTLAHFDYLLPRLFGDTDIDKGGEINGSVSLDTFKDVAEKKAILNALSKTKGNKTAAANELNIHRTVLYDKMRKHGIV